MEFNDLLEMRSIHQQTEGGYDLRWVKVVNFQRFAPRSGSANDMTIANDIPSIAGCLRLSNIFCTHNKRSRECSECFDGCLSVYATLPSWQPESDSDGDGSTESLNPAGHVRRRCWRMPNPPGYEHRSNKKAGENHRAFHIDSPERTVVVA